MRPEARTSFAQSLSIQGRVIGALLMREIMTRYGRHNIGFLWLFAEPMLFTLAVTLLWGGLKLNHVSALPITAFAVTGYSGVLLWRNMPGRLIQSVTPNLALMYHRNVKIIDIFVSRLLLEFLGATMSFVILTIGFTAIGWMSLPEDVLQVIGGWIMLTWFGSALAIWLGALSEDHDLVEKLWHPFAYIVMPISGAGFIVDSLPQQLQEIVLYVPTISAMEFIREGFFGSVIVSHYDMEYLLWFNMALTILGLAKMMKVGREVVPE